MSTDDEATKTLYAHIPASLKERLERLAKYNMRKINAELTIAIRLHCETEEKRLGLSDEDE